MIAGVMPQPLFAAISAVVVVAVGISLARMAGRVPTGVENGQGMGPWRAWQLVAGVGGLSMVAQVRANVCLCVRVSTCGCHTTCLTRCSIAGAVSQGGGGGY